MQPQSSSRPSNPLLLCQGYGYIPKAVMADRRINCNAKALYAYLCSLSGKEGAAWPDVKRICQDLGFGAAVFRAALKSLVEAGYVKALRERRMNRYSHYVYELSQDIPASRAIPQAESQALENQKVDPQTVGVQTIGLQAAAKHAPNNTNGSNNTTATFLEEDEDPSLTPRARGPEDLPANALKEIERRRAAQIAKSQPHEIIPDAAQARKDAAGRWFREAYGRRANTAEASILADLLAFCSAGAVERMIHASAAHAPAAPALYVRRMAARYRAGAAAMRLITSPLETLTVAMMDQVEDRDRPFG